MTDFELGIVVTCISIIGVFFLTVAFIYLYIWFSEVNEMRKEYLDKKYKKLYNRKQLGGVGYGR